MFEHPVQIWTSIQKCESALKSHCVSKGAPSLEKFQCKSSYVHGYRKQAVHGPVLTTPRFSFQALQVWLLTSPGSSLGIMVTYRPQHFSMSNPVEQYCQPLIRNQPSCSQLPALAAHLVHLHPIGIEATLHNAALQSVPTSGRHRGCGLGKCSATATSTISQGSLLWICHADAR